MSDELHPPETITTIYLLRHGHTEPTEQGRLYNDPAVELTEKGRQQAKLLGKWLSVNQTDLLLSSTAKRVVSTASIIEETIGMKSKPVDNLNEWSVGTWEGHTYLEIKKERPDEYSAWSSDPIENAPPGGESIVDLCNRIRVRLFDVIDTHKGKRLALVTHAGVIRAILLEALGIPVRNFWRLSIPVGSISHVDFSDNFATVKFTSHMP